MVRFLCAASLVLFAACDVGSTLPGPGGGGDDDDDPGIDAQAIDAPVPAYAIAVDPPTRSTALGTEVTYVVTIQASGTFNGPVTLAATGAPASWTVSFDPPTVNAQDGGTVASEMKVVIPSNGEAAPAGTALTVEATAAPGPRTAAATLTVANEYTFSIAPGTGTGLHFGAMSGGLMRLRAGTTLHIANNDTVGHRIHAGGGVFPHQDNTMAPGQSYTVTVLDGSDTFYCHDHGQDKGEVNVNAQ